MTGVKMRSAVQRVGGWVGTGMTIGFRERAMRTDGPWLPPKIPLRKMAGLTYFWTHHAVQIYCIERRGEYTFRGYNPRCFRWTLWDYIRCCCIGNAGIN